MAKEQRRIEAELKAFEEQMWGDQQRKDSLDSIAAASKDVKTKESEEVAPLFISIEKELRLKRFLWLISSKSFC